MADQVLKYSISGDSSGATAAFKDVAAAIQRTEDKADKFASSVDKLKDSFQKQVAGMSQHSASIERQVAGMSAQSNATSNLVGGMSSLSGAVGLVTGAFAAYGAMEVASWIKNQAAAAVEYGASLQDMSDRLGINTDKLQVYSAWAELSGTSTETLAKSIAKLEVSIAKGDKELASFGVTSLDADQAFMQVVAAVEKAPTQFEKARIAEAAFGKGWAELMPVLNAGTGALKEMTENTSIVDAEDIQRMAKMDDSIAALNQSFRALGVEIVAAFGPAFVSTMDYAARKIRELNDTFTDENKEGSVANIRKIGNDPRLQVMGWSALKSGKENREIILNLAEMDRSSALMQKAEELAGSQREQREAAARLEADRQKEANEKKAEAARKAGVAELEFQRGMNDQLALLQATADQRELIAIDQKYAALREKHKANKESILAIEMAHQAELQNYYLQQNFGRLGQERDADIISNPEQTPGDPNSPLSVRYQFNKGRNSQIIGSPSLGDAVSNAPDYMQNEWGEKGASVDQIKKEYQSFLIESKREMDSIAESVADKFSGTLGPAIVDSFTQPQDAIKNLKEAGLLAVDAIAKEVSILIVKWLVLKAVAASFGASGPLDLGSFLLAGISGHADGTMSSPGGLRYLGENGAEPYETPYGQRGIATYGLYQVPAGTRVQSAGNGSAMGTKEYHLHTREADPIQVGEIFRRVVREEIMILDSEKYRGRQFD